MSKKLPWYRRLRGPQADAPPPAPDKRAFVWRLLAAAGRRLSLLRAAPPRPEEPRGR